MDIKLTIEKLLEYAKVHLRMDDLDMIYFRNILLNRLDVDSPYIGELDLEYIKELEVPDSIINEVKEYLISKGDENPDLLVTEIMGLLSPLPSTVSFLTKEMELVKPGLGLDYLHD